MVARNFKPAYQHCYRPETSGWETVADVHAWEDSVLLTQHEQERLLIHVAAEVAWKRRERGLRLNYPEAVAVITAYLLEGARDGRGVSELMEDGRRVLGRDDVLDGVADMLTEVQVEATFPDGTKLVTVHDPIP